MAWGHGRAFAILGLATLLAGCSSAPFQPITISVTPSKAQAFDQSLHLGIQAALTNDVNAKGVSWSLSGAGSLSGTTGSSVLYYPPTANLTSAAQVTVTATSVADRSKSASVQLTVNPNPYLANQTVADGTVGKPYQQPIVLTGGTAPFQWSVYNGPLISGNAVGGAVPDGLTLNPATGVLSGTPTGAGTWYFEMTATDVDNEFAAVPISVRIAPASASAANPVPFLNQPLLPASVAVGGPAFMLKLSGTGFVPGATVDFNGIPLATTFVDTGHLTAMVPAANVVAAKTAAITAVNPLPGGGASGVVYLPVGSPQSSVSFALAPYSPLGIQEAFSLAVADLNEDGKPDLLIAGNVRAYVMLGNGDGTFALAAGSPIYAPSPPYDDFGSPYVGPVAIGDFNRSGHLGVAIEEAADEAAMIFLGDGTGKLVTSSAVFAAAGEASTAIAAADFNGDGNLDLALIDELPGTAYVALGYGKGAFNAGGPLLAGTTGFPLGAAVGDFNGDGKLDVALAEASAPASPGLGSGVAVALGKGDGTFTQASGSPLGLGLSLTAAVAGDFNRDGKLDLAVTDQVGNAVFILLGKGDGTFQPAIKIAVGSSPSALTMGDFNRDGQLDLAIANSGDGTVTLLLGHGDGTFAQASGSPYVVGMGPSAIVAADFNGDGKLDLAVANNIGVSILLQR